MSKILIETPAHGIEVYLEGHLEEVSESFGITEERFREVFYQIVPNVAVSGKKQTEMVQLLLASCTTQEEVVYSLFELGKLVGALDQLQRWSKAAEVLPVPMIEEVVFASTTSWLRSRKILDLVKEAGEKEGSKAESAEELRTQAEKAIRDLLKDDD